METKTVYIGDDVKHSIQHICDLYGRSHFLEYDSTVYLKD